MWLRRLLLLFAASTTGAAATTRGLALTVDRATGAFSVAVDAGDLLFAGSGYEFTSENRTARSSDGSLVLGSATTGAGADASGAYVSTTLVWAAGAFVTEFREYRDAGMIVFEQRFPKGARGTSLNASDPYSARDDVSTAFPSFNSTFGANIGHLAFSSDMTDTCGTHRTGPVGSLPTGVTGFGPTCFFTRDLSSSAVLSSFSNFMAASNGARSDHAQQAFGVQGSIAEIPPGYSLSFVLAASRNGGVNRALEEWGDRLLQRYGKTREMSYRDYSLNYLGYSTDNGAYYYYQTEGHTPGKPVGEPAATGPWKNYEQTLIDVRRYADSEKIPYKYALLDSWWYYKGVGNGVTNWVGRPDIFPHGNDYVRNATGWPIMGHNRYWAVDNVYAAANGGDYDFVIEKKGQGQGYMDFAWPTEQRFWDDFIRNATEWGLFLYEQDWLDTEYDSVVFLNVNATAGRTWLMQMGSAAADNDVTIQYCMSHVRQIMQSVEIPAVTNARASGDCESVR